MLSRDLPGACRRMKRRVLAALWSVWWNFIPSIFWCILQSSSLIQWCVLALKGSSRILNLGVIFFWSNVIHFNLSLMCEKSLRHSYYLKSLYLKKKRKFRPEAWWKNVSYFIGSWCFHGNRIFTAMALRWPLFRNNNIILHHMTSSLCVMDLDESQEGRNRFPLLRSHSCHVRCLKTSFT